MTLPLTPSELSAALSSSFEEDKDLLGTHPDPLQMTDEQAKAIVEAGNRYYLRLHWGRQFDEQLMNCFSKHVHVYENGFPGGPSIGREPLGRAIKDDYLDGKLYMTNLKVHEVIRTGQYLLEWSTWEENDGEKGYYSIVWIYEDGLWRRKWEIFT
ncbi:unnamed protein product [Adineta steineri]|uniref:DUF4440 domain-containing protein n=1 Tax=Adineta steineri TaxID=433720 RepID=A0A814TJ69_9BILA|nr:unnamed protein product [Adineta steineri]CAF1162992.1 unnamed protein product [Adineta steineri]CAF3673078.1 unnamed protein product [Adineta steineri]CAF3961751.1 unnamed protein product [Adineta steineri]